MQHTCLYTCHKLLFFFASTLLRYTSDMILHMLLTFWYVYVLEIWKLMWACMMHCPHHSCFRYISCCSYLCIFRYISPILLFLYDISSLCSLLYLIHLPLELTKAKQYITFLFVLSMHVAYFDNMLFLIVLMDMTINKLIVPLVTLHITIL